MPEVCAYPGDVFTLSDWSDMVDEFGVEMKYYQSTICSCVGENDGQPDTDCDCYAGFRYPNNPVFVKILRTSVSMRGLPERVGLELQGGCYLTIPRCYKSGDSYYENEIYDKVNVGDVFVVNTRTRRDRDILKKDVRDSLNAFDVDEVLSVSKNGTIYEQDVDYQLNNFRYPLPFWYVGFNSETDLNSGKKTIGGEIEWLTGGDAPAENDFYTVEFWSKIQYIVWQDLAQDRGTEEDYLPKKILCKLRQFVNFGTSQLDSINV